MKRIMLLLKHLKSKCCNPNGFVRLKYTYTSTVNDLVKPITVNTGKTLYPILKLKNPKLYRHYKSGGLDLTVNYLDTKPNGREYSKVILAIHGSTDTLYTFTKLVEQYRNSDVRVIAPNLPDFTHTRHNKIFWHTQEEKAHFIRDFLHKLKIDTIDCYVSHSFGIQAAATLCQQPLNLNIKSFAMFTPMPLVCLKGKILLEIAKLVHTFKYEQWYKFLSILRLHRFRYSPVQMNDLNDLLLFAVILFNEESLLHTASFFKSIGQTNTPCVVLLGPRDTIMSDYVKAKTHELLSIPPEQRFRIDPNKVNPDNFKLKHRQSSYSIEGAGHFVHANYSRFANKLVDNILQFV